MDRFLKKRKTKKKVSIKKGNWNNKNNIERIQKPIQSRVRSVRALCGKMNECDGISMPKQPEGEVTCSFVYNVY